MNIGIDATNIGFGGGTTHVKEILDHLGAITNKNSIDKIIVFSSEKILSQLPDSELIDKVTFPALNRGLISRLYFQILFFDKEIKKRCDILLSLTGDYIGNFKPVVGMCRNMLLYERDIWKEIKQLKEILRFWIIYQKQKFSFKNSDGIIFVSNYAKDYVLNQLDLRGKQITVISHGISPRFSHVRKTHKPISEYSFSNPYNLVYVSTIHVYKHQWNVVKAIGALRTKGFPVVLHLFGGVIFEPAGQRLNGAITEIDPNNEFIFYHGHLPYLDIDNYYKDSDGIIFASSCENMPNVLMESMASGRPIACSNKQPMPEFLKENGFYFNSYDSSSIEKAIEKMILNPEICEDLVQKNIVESRQYSWEKSSNETFDFIEKIYKKYFSRKG